MISRSDTRFLPSIRRFLPKYLCALILSPYLLTIGVLSRKHRFLIFQIAQHFGMKLSHEEMAIPAIALSSVFDSHWDLTVLEPIGKSGNVSLLELMILARFARQCRMQTAFEIGTFDGRTAINLAANMADEGRVWTLDLRRCDLGQTAFDLAPQEEKYVNKESSGDRFRATPMGSKIEQLYGDSATFDFAPYENKIGLVFVDGSHTYDYVMKDSISAMRAASDSGSIILWHDYQQDWPDVIRALDDLYKTDRNFSGLRRIDGTSLVMLKREDSRR